MTATLTITTRSSGKKRRTLHPTLVDARKALVRWQSKHFSVRIGDGTRGSLISAGVPVFDYTIRGDR